MVEHESHELRALRSATVDAEAPTVEVLLTPWGVVRSTQGEFIVDEDGVAEAVRAFTAHGTDLPIDYEHQTLGGAYAAPNGQAPAAGWIKALIARPGAGLFGRIEWTEAARQQLAAREYRYLSPVALVRRSDRRLVGIHSAALTNKPAIAGMTPIVNRDSVDFRWRGSGGTEGDPAAPSEASDEVEALVLLRREVGLGEDADVREVLTAAGRRLAELSQRQRARRARDRVLEAVRAGKLVEAQRGWAEELALRDEQLFEQWLATAPVVVVPGRTTPPVEAGAKYPAAAGERARAEYRSHPLLQKLTDEAAYVAMALREEDLRG